MKKPLTRKQQIARAMKVALMSLESDALTHTKAKPVSVEIRDGVEIYAPLYANGYVTEEPLPEMEDFEKGGCTEQQI